MGSLEDSRDEIDRLDRDIVRLIAERMDAVRRIGSFKRHNPSAPLRDEERERVVFEAWSREAERAGLSSYFVGRVLREILNYSRRDQERLLDGVSAEGGVRSVRVGYQGAAACDADLAIAKLFAARDVEGVSRIGFANFSAALDALVAGDLEYALLPIEDTVSGSLHEVYDLLTRRSVTIVGEELWPVEHCLVGHRGATLAQVRTIRSHPTVLQQCRTFLDGLVGTTLESVNDTSAAAEAVAREADPALAAIASEEVARQWGLAVLRRDLSDHHANFTRFLLVATQPEECDPRLPGKTSIVIALNHRRGALLACLSAFNRHGINLSKLESRPQPSAPWEYLFYLDLEGYCSDPSVSGALDEVRHHTNHLKVLGSYPARLDEVERERIFAPEAGGDVALNSVETMPATDAGEVPALPERVSVEVGGVSVGVGRFVVVGGPAGGASRQELFDLAALLRRAGAGLLRGVPGSLDDLREAGRAYELSIVLDVSRVEEVAAAAGQADMLQLAAREMQDADLLREVGHCQSPVLLRRAPGATLEELAAAAQRIASWGNRRVVLCERGVDTRGAGCTLDLAAITVLRSLSPFPVLVDPTRSARDAATIVSLSLAAAAAGADGLLIDVEPEERTQGRAALLPAELVALMSALRPVLAAVGRKL